MKADTANPGDRWDGDNIIPQALPEPTADQLKATLIAKAQSALDKSDVTIIRCMENDTSVPVEWAQYRETLREIVASGTGNVPAQPAYPKGT